MSKESSGNMVSPHVRREKARKRSHCIESLNNWVREGRDAQ